MDEKRADKPDRHLQIGRPHHAPDRHASEGRPARQAKRHRHGQGEEQYRQERAIPEPEGRGDRACEGHERDKRQKDRR